MENRSEYIMGHIRVDLYKSKVRDAPMPDLMKTTNPEQNNNIDMVKDLYQLYGDFQAPPSSSNKDEIKGVKKQDKLKSQHQNNLIPSPTCYISQPISKKQDEILMKQEIHAHGQEIAVIQKIEVPLFQGSTRIYTSEERNQRNPSLLLKRCSYSTCYMGQHWRDIPTARINIFKTAFNRNGTYCICGQPVQYGFISDSGEEKWVGHGTARKYLKNL
jgi:hypothetical protein